ncbi:hypothetical protein V2G26_013419 [Clonostachys chloroleuca]
MGLLKLTAELFDKSLQIPQPLHDLPNPSLVAPVRLQVLGRRRRISRRSSSSSGVVGDALKPASPFGRPVVRGHDAGDIGPPAVGARRLLVAPDLAAPADDAAARFGRRR